MKRLAALCSAAQVPEGLIQVLPESPAAAEAAIHLGVDKVVFTGSRRVGQVVAAQLAQQVTPGVFELSGNDAVVVCDDADLDRVAATVAYALGLNGGQSCIAPRKIVATEPIMRELLPRLCAHVNQQPPRSVPPLALAAARRAVEAALDGGATVVAGGLEHWGSAQQIRPLVLAGVRLDMPVAYEDLFAPVLSLITAQELTQAVADINRSPYALGASVFGSSVSAQEIAEQLQVGCVTINDVLVPTADPRVSFGGWRASGYGVTRGLEGLRELSQLKVTCERRGRQLPHLVAGSHQLESLMRGLLWLRHGRTLKQRWRGVQQLMKTTAKGKR
jgi:acyl-CoA reductase-like NAD-dependent aldehyde dehydrogenase